MGLQDFPGTDRLGCSGNSPADFRSGKTGGQLQRVREQTIAEQNGNLIAPVRRQRGPLPAQQRFIHHIVMNKRGQVHHFDDHRHRDKVVVWSADTSCAQGHQCRAQLFALICERVLGISRDFRIEGLHLLGQLPGHSLQKWLDRLHNLFPGMRRFFGRRGDGNRFGFGGQHGRANLKLRQNQVKPKCSNSYGFGNGSAGGLGVLTTNWDHKARSWRVSFLYDRNRQSPRPGRWLRGRPPPGFRVKPGCDRTGNCWSQSHR